MNIVVVGDVLLDVDMNGNAERLCPDAPVPVVDVTHVDRRAGGAGLVARMLARDGEQVRLVTVLSDDGAGASVRESLAGIDVVPGPSGAPTPVKTRIRVQGQPVVRFDEGCAPAHVPAISAAMISAVQDADVLLVSDYGRGLTANPELRQLLELRARQVPVVWDPHPSGAAPVPGVAAVTPNRSEARRAAVAGGPYAVDAPPTGSVAGPVDGAADAMVDGAAEGTAGAARDGTVLLRRWKAMAMVVTLGERGAMVLAGDDALPYMVPAPQVHLNDPCGAGDRFAASLAVQLGRGVELHSAADTAVREAAAFLADGGVQSLLQPVQPRQLHSNGIDALRIARQTRERGGTVVATGGCFDLLHAGHSRTLSAARALGDCLIVCLNSDDSTRRLKGDGRPIIGQLERAELLLSLECVDAVLVFDEDSPNACLERLRPDLWVKGGDYTIGQLPEAELVSSWGGQTLTVPYYPAHSTSQLAAALENTGVTGTGQAHAG
ncbi:bifunctional heptose 7-phosphate kinase/heptose 1-phosphate adenyltransferase [Paenarthrobacter sp. Z7-10]|uniref:PfkB family carbohydrate kinase n=1 Tax=Paenarthrobacter sp. Z7-10 TaxID=2787635 RepID=UPI0022A9EDA1|nr:PfkB family carbohydrate kinase [Paenarthrobacter sp. Z7-10]MCZ2403145.1 bifunctional heptose 7-phosphate kinase/heptose 1-phosphate adenyltransferase [Paenarthrobacter sp. Z7-10]